MLSRLASALPGHTVHRYEVPRWNQKLVVHEPMRNLLRTVHAWEVDIDRYVNRVVPHPQWHRFPKPLAHFLGYRSNPEPNKIGNVLIMFWSLVGIFTGLLIVTAVSKHTPSFQERGVPIVVGSFGAAAVLEYCAIESPLAQPRNAVLGHLFAAIIGRSVTELFLLSPRHDELWWIAGPLGCALATLVMVLTKTVHPPAGATALLAIVDANTRHLGWFLLPVVLLSSVLILASALIFNNIQRKFPLHWWTPDTLSRQQTKEFDSSSSETESEETYRMSQALERGGVTGPPAPIPAPSELDHIAVKHGQVLIPDGIILAPDEVEFLERLSRRI